MKQEHLKKRKIKPCNPFNVSEANGKKWQGYHLKTKDREPREVLVNFLNSHNGEFSSALDLGCGAFADSVYIAKQGIPVIAMDLSVNRDILREQYKMGGKDVKQNLSAQVQDFAHLNLPKADFVYSFAALPFCPEASFINMLTNITSSVNPNGYLALHFFEEKHPFVKRGTARGFTPKQLEEAFNYLGFTGTQITEWQDEKTQNGDHLPNLNSIFLTAQAPKQLPEFSRQSLQEILGLKVEQEPMDELTQINSQIFNYVEEQDGLDIYSADTNGSNCIQESIIIRAISPSIPEPDITQENETILPIEENTVIKTSYLATPQDGEQLTSTLAFQPGTDLPPQDNLEMEQ